MPPKRSTTPKAQRTASAHAVASQVPPAAPAAVTHKLAYDGPKIVKTDAPTEDQREIPLLIQALVYLQLTGLMIFSYAREFVRNWFFPDKALAPPAGYAPMLKDYDDFYIRRLYRRIRDNWNRPIDSRPSRIIRVMERETKDFNRTFQLTGRTIPCINMGSYNYLGFADNIPTTTQRVIDSIRRYGVASCSAALEAGRTSELEALEDKVAQFVGKEAAIVCGMGFTTNFSGIPALTDRDTLVISDSLNHASIVAGARMAHGRIKVFPHNNWKALEKIIKAAIVEGQPRTHRLWKRIVIAVEGVYSMEGEIVNLPKIVEIKKKYKILLYVDEAHSIGALGKNGRGVCDYYQINPADVDILMGTLTKSFGSIGGYIASTKEVIDSIRRTSAMSLLADTLSAPCATQALSTMEIIMGEDGTDIGATRIKQLEENSHYFRSSLAKLGFTVFGDDSSPVVPVMLYAPSKMPGVSHHCLANNVAVCVVGYPATSLIESRVRFCISASHTREDLDHTVAVMKQYDEDHGMLHYEFLRKKKSKSA